MKAEFSVQWSFPLLFTEDVFAPGNPILSSVIPAGARVLLFADGKVPLPAHAARFQPEIVTPGELIKDGLGAVARLAETMLAAHLDRQGCVLIAGGGAVLDAVGLAAALVHRGVRVIRLPTTVLAQNDAGVGVKNGVNFAGVKNGLGTFAPPWAVINDFAFLRSLPAREWRSGIAEAWKVALIRDAAFFDFLCDSAEALSRRDEPAMRHLVRRCAELHLQHICDGGDPFERGTARPLDFGHWSAHRLEVESGFRITHGEAVAAGVLLDSAYAHLTGQLAAADLARLQRGLRAGGFVLPAELSTRDAAGRLAILEGLRDFREHLGGELTITLPDGVGQRREVHAMDEALVEQALNLVLAPA